MQSNILPTGPEELRRVLGSIGGLGLRGVDNALQPPSPGVSHDIHGAADVE